MLEKAMGTACFSENLSIICNSCIHEFFKFFRGAGGKSVFINNDIIIFIAQQEVMFPCFNTGELAEIVFAMAFAGGLREDIFGHFNSAWFQKIIADAALVLFDLIAGCIFDKGVNTINDCNDQNDGADQGSCIVIFQAEPTKVNGGGCGENADD